MPSAPLAKAQRHATFFADTVEPHGEPKAGDAPPTSSSTKAQIGAWLDAAGVDHPADATKAELLDLVAGAS